MSAPAAVRPQPGPGAARREVVRSVAARHLGRRRRWGRIATAVCAATVCLALAPLVSLVAYIVDRGGRVLSPGFLVHTPKPIFLCLAHSASTCPGSGIGNAIVGTVIIVGLAMVMAVPVGLATSLFVVEGPSKLSAAIRFAADVLSGTPSIAIGVFAYAVIVLSVGYSGLAGSFALAVLMLPIMVRADEEAMAGVPVDLWEAGLALGPRRGRVVRSVVLRSALPGIVTGNLLAMARAVGETAPLIFTIFGSQFYALRPTAPMAAMPLTIYGDATEPFKSAQATAWGTALVLLALVVVVSMIARGAASFLTRKAR